MALLFWISLVALGYTFAGYPLLIALLARVAARKSVKTPISPPPLISVVLAVRNEATRIRARLENLLASDYPSLQVVVTSDGSTDGTETVVEKFGDSRVRLSTRHERTGKAACLNHSVSLCAGELLVFADARQQFSTTALSELAANFADERTGAVSGTLVIDSSTTSVGSGVDAYWRLEKFIRRAESQFDSSIGCTGAIYAMRKVLFQPIPDDTILDDVVIPMQAALQGYRVLFDPAAKAFDPQPLDPEIERRRKRRTLAGNFQMLARHPAWLLPWENRLWWELISHKYLRLAAPAMMVGALASNAVLALRLPLLYGPLLTVHALFYLLALAGLLGLGRSRLVSWPAGFLFLNAMTVRGFLYFLGIHREASQTKW